MVQRAVGEAQLNGAAARQHLENASAFLRLFRAAPIGGVEHHSIAGFERRQLVRFGRIDGHAGFRNCGHASHPDAAMTGRAPAHQRLVIRAVQKVRARSARVNLLQIELLARVDIGLAAFPRGVHRLPISARGERDVIRVFVAAFDLQCGDADPDDLRYLPQREQVARRKQIAGVAQRLHFAIHNQLVWQAAGLRALAAIGAAAAPGLA